VGRINSRDKGAKGEREFINMMGPLLGVDLKRNLEQTREGGHDILGLDGWAIEIKRYAEVLPADLERWWDQAVEQSLRITWKNVSPALAYRADRRPWRIVIPSERGLEYDYTIEMSPILFGYWVKK
jgi:hypothetical protein